MLMGLDNWLHACAWYLKSFVVWIIPLLILVFFITFDWPTGAVFQYSDPLVLMAILTLYVAAGISYCFLISACFKKGKSRRPAKRIYMYSITTEISPFPFQHMIFILVTKRALKVIGTCCITNFAYFSNLFGDFLSTQNRAYFKDVF